jgi:two-component system, chemotaxis family, sensor kinase CheA
MDFDDSLLDEFIAEANEHLLSIEDDFLALERQKEAPEQELVDKVFRAIHSVKGGAAFVGLGTIKELAHAMENLLSKVRSGELELQSGHIDALLQGVDLLNTMVAAPAQSDKVDIANLHTHLKELLAGAAPPVPTSPRLRPAPKLKPAPEPVPEPEPKPAPEPKPKPKPKPTPEPKPLRLPALPEDSTIQVDADARLLLEQALLAGDNIYFLRMDLGATEAPPLNELIPHVESSGQIIVAGFASSGVDLEAAPDAPLRADFLLAAGQPPQALGQVIAIPKKDILPSDAPKPEEPEPDAATLVAETPDTEPDAPDLLEAADAPEDEEFEDEEFEAGEFDQEEQESVPHMTAPPPLGAADIVPTLPGGPQKQRSSFIRINVALLDKLMTLAGELVLVRNQQLLSMERSDAASRDMVQRLDIVTSELQETIMQTRMQPIGNIFNKLPRIARDLGNTLGKEIEIQITGNEVELDKTILESLNDPLIHIIRNCCDHGIESPEEREHAGKHATGIISLHAYHEGGQINIQIADDGKGIDPQVIRRTAAGRGIRNETELSQMSDREVISLVMLPGFSTARKISEVSGRGVGMDVVRHAIESLGGSLELDSWPGQGTSLHLRLPLTLAIIPCLIVTVAGNRFAIPQVNLEELVCLYEDDVTTRIEVAGNQEVYRLRNRLLPMVRLSEVLARPRPFTRDTKADIAEKYHRGARDSQADEPEPSRRDDANLTLLSQELTPADYPPESLSFAVVRVGSERFGLIVDKVLGTEEIVVKPMHPSLKSLKCYSGATVMGDGSVSLILDIEGIARHAGVFLEQPEDEIMTRHGSSSSDDDTQSILLFRNGPREQFALALPLIRRIEKISLPNIEVVGSKEFITIDDQSTLVLRLDALLTVSPCQEKDDMFLILPKFIKRPFGILMSQILDIEEAHISLNTESYQEDGLLGTDIIRGHLTLFPDIFRLIELAEPQWFSERRLAHPPPTEKKRILIVEDSSFLRHMIRRYLEADGYEVAETEHGQEALDTLEEKDFDLVVSDIEMPVMNGLEFIKTLRHGGRLHDIPALALTSLNSEEDMRRALKAGFDRYQVKLDRELFLADVTRMLTGEVKPMERH